MGFTLESKYFQIKPYTMEKGAVACEMPPQPQAGVSPPSPGGCSVTVSLVAMS